ncbi:peptidase domain-containing ABC transporter [Helcococcus ovis]|uniref:peptidase domain-containing ABC transporter n=1 Tax=Helcococcus ovis TaxID=72026 RepID=UPI0010701994|nr:peptidase domain-containing ABC transporter [Helcococcus ovis]TFF65825.1 peptidase domain-containing ABC transporter [Helcococcus ovis]WNZ00745.1 peptidase domain-containing ABC transporter [Helcococcus ovis]
MKYYCIKQHDITDCGAACLATISKQNGYKIGITKIREVAGTDKQGTNAYGIIKAAEQLGFSAKGVKGNKEAFFTEFPLPCIAHVVVNGSLLHYVVIHKITKKQVIIADPGSGIVKLRPEEFFGEVYENGKPPKYQWTGVLILLVKSENFKKGDETKGLFSRFFSLLIPQKALIFNIFIASLIYTFLGILGAFYFKELLDNVLPNALYKTLMTLSIGVILLNIFKVLLNTFRTHLLLYLSQKLDIALLLGYYRHVIDLPMNFFGTRKVGEIISRFNDAGKVRDAISGATLTIMIDTLMAIAGAIILFNQNSKLFFITIIMIILYVIIVVLFNKWYEKLNRNQMEDNAQLTSYMVESLNGIQTVKAYNSERKVKQETETKFIKLLKSVFNLSWVSNFQTSLKTFVELIGGVVIIWVGGISVINGEMTIGSLITFNSLLVYFLDPVKNLVNLQPQMQTAVVAADRLGEILDLEAEKTEKEYKKLKPDSLSGDIEIKNVNFRYGTRKLVLENINIDIKKGQKIAFVGESGSGKTTLSKLLLNLYESESGDILINGNNIKDIQLEKLREKIAYIPQETFLFSGSILENLALGLDTYTLEDIYKASKMAQAHDFINELPLRYETRLEENGSNLSGGQRQRLAIARAMLKNPDILILDEATSNLDSITEKALDRTIHEFAKDITTIFIAHRLSTIKDSDMIYVFEKGKIIERGTHEELIKLGGKYSELSKQQSLELEGREEDL